MAAAVSSLAAAAAACAASSSSLLLQQQHQQLLPRAAASLLLLLRQRQQHASAPCQQSHTQQHHHHARAFSAAATASAPPQQKQQQQRSTTTAEVGRLNHVAIAVPDLAKAAARYRDVLGATVSAQQPVPEHGVTVVFVELPNTKIELLHPLGERSPIAKFLERNPAGGIHHVCLEVADVRRSLAALTPAGVRVLDPEPKIGAHGNPVVFLHPKDNDGVLLELEEVGGDSS